MRSWFAPIGLSFAFFLAAVHASPLPQAPVGSSPPAEPAAPSPPGPSPNPPKSSTAPAPAALFTVRGTLRSEDGSVPKQAAVFLEGIAASALGIPKEPLLISQRGARFRPDFAVAVVGQPVDLPNDDRIVHNVFSVSPIKKFDLGHYGQGEKRSIRFDRAGVAELFCNIHETMQGVILVVPSPHFSLVGADGSFSIGGVPSGKYQVAAYVRSGALTRTPIAIGSSEPTPLVLTLPAK